jgi:endo-1,4-beta-D-glucanase Y
LQDAWTYFKQHFITGYGQVIDPNNQGLTTSTAQTQTMARAVAENDQKTFEGVWQWTQDHLRHRQSDVLLSWKWTASASGSYSLADANNVCAADQQAAAALYAANDKWPGFGYHIAAARQTADWWAKCVFKAGGRYFVDSSADGSRNPHLVNPGYFDPALYAYLATKQPSYEWSQLMSDGYQTTNSLLDKGPLPDWILVSANGEVTSARSVMGATADAFGYDSLDLVYHLAQESLAADELRAAAARQVLDRLAAPLREFRTRTDSPPADIAWLIHAQTAQPADKQQLQTLYAYEIFDQYHQGEGFWGDGRSYQDQLWYWQWHDLQRHLPAASRLELK